MQERRVVNEAGLTQFFSRIYTLMGSGLVVTALVSYLLGVTLKNDYINFVGAHPIIFWIMSALFGVIIMMFVNMFMGSSGMQMLISYAILIIFIVLTAWDTQRLKNLYLTAGSDGQATISTSSLAVVGALMLYLDFLNLFTAILQILGVGDNNN